MESKLFSVAEISERLNVNRKVVYKLCSDGQLPHFRIGKHIRVSIKDLEIFLKDNRVSN